MKVISCGIILTDFYKMLICHPTHSPWIKSWSIPKGGLNDGESFKEAASREFTEETSLKCSKNIILLGKYHYRKDKDLVFFLDKVEKLPNINKLKCQTFVKSEPEDFPEVDSFKYIDFTEDEITKWLNKNQSIALIKALKENRVVLKNA